MNITELERNQIENYINQYSDDMLKFIKLTVEIEQIKREIKLLENK